MLIKNIKAIQILQYEKTYNKMVWKTMKQIGLKEKLTETIN